MFSSKEKKKKNDSHLSLERLRVGGDAAPAKHAIEVVVDVVGAQHHVLERHIVEQLHALQAVMKNVAALHLQSRLLANNAAAGEAVGANDRIRDDNGGVVDRDAARVLLEHASCL